MPAADLLTTTSIKCASQQAGLAPPMWQTSLWAEDEWQSKEGEDIHHV